MTILSVDKITSTNTSDLQIMASSNVLIWIGIFCSINFTHSASLSGQCADSPCLNNGVCHQLQNGRHACVCQAGWAGSDCSVDIDECSMDDVPTCQYNRVCINTQGSFKCVCSSGYTGERCERKLNSIKNKRLLLLSFPTPPRPMTTVTGTTLSPPPFTTKVPPSPNTIKTPKPITDAVVATTPITTVAPPDLTGQPIG